MQKFSSQIEADKFFLELSIKQAKKAQKKGEVPVGAVLICENNKIIAKSYNKPIKNNDPTAHAEIMVLRKAGKKLNNYRLINTTMYVSLEPCPMCFAAISNARVSRVVFAAKNNKGNNLNHFFSTDFIENTSYINLLKSFFKKKRT